MKLKQWNNAEDEEEAEEEEHEKTQKTMKMKILKKMKFATEHILLQTNICVWKTRTERRRKWRRRQRRSWSRRRTWRWRQNNERKKWNEEEQENDEDHDDDESKEAVKTSEEKLKKNTMKNLKKMKKTKNDNRKKLKEEEKKQDEEKKVIIWRKSCKKLQRRSWRKTVKKVKNIWETESQLNNKCPTSMFWKRATKIRQRGRRRWHTVDKEGQWRRDVPTRSHPEGQLFCFVRICKLDKQNEFPLQSDSVNKDVEGQRQPDS